MNGSLSIFVYFYRDSYIYVFSAFCLPACRPLSIASLFEYLEVFFSLPHTSKEMNGILSIVVYFYRDSYIYLHIFCFLFTYLHAGRSLLLAFLNIWKCSSRCLAQVKSLDDGSECYSP